MSNADRYAAIAWCIDYVRHAGVTTLKADERIERVNEAAALLRELRESKPLAWYQWHDNKFWAMPKQPDELDADNPKWIPLYAHNQPSAEVDEVAKMRWLLSHAICPDCDGSGTIQIDPENTVECMWCRERARSARGGQPCL